MKAVQTFSLKEVLNRHFPKFVVDTICSCLSGFEISHTISP